MEAATQLDFNRGQFYVVVGCHTSSSTDEKRCYMLLRPEQVRRYVFLVSTLTALPSVVEHLRKAATSPTGRSWHLGEAVRSLIAFVPYAGNLVAKTWDERSREEAESSLPSEEGKAILYCGNVKVSEMAAKEFAKVLVGPQGDKGTRIMHGMLGSNRPKGLFEIG